MADQTHTLNYGAFLFLRGLDFLYKLFIHYKIFNMPTERSKQNIERANTLLKEAENEMFKAQEDLVAMTVCHNARLSVRKYLEALILKHGEEPSPANDNENLLERCKKIEPGFHEITTDSFYCRSGDFCTDLKKLENCLAFAKKIQRFVVDEQSETWPLSKPVK